VERIDKSDEIEGKGKLPELVIGNLRAKLPVIQGGMGVGISLSGLASAVANEGGIGVIAAVGMAMLKDRLEESYRKTNVRELKKEIRKAREMTDGIVGVNIMVALTDFENLLRASFEEEADIVFLGAGLPLRVPQIIPPEEINNGKTRLGVIVSSARAANIIFRSWAKHGCVPDAVVVEGPKAGGHLGFKNTQIEDENYRLEYLVPAVIEAVRPYEERFEKEIPVIAGGGIYTGEDIHRYLTMGAKGVQMATRFVPTFECDASLEFKEAYINAKEEDLVIIESPVGLPGRAINNNFLRDVKAGKKKPFKCPWKCLVSCDYKTTPYCIAKALANAQRGDLENGFVFAGSNAYRTEEITSVHSVIESIKREYSAATRELLIA